jgi:hypothetical protein
VSPTSPVFEWVGEELAKRTGVAALQARGTLRLALQTAGLEPRTLDKEQMLVVLERVLGPQLELRRVANAATICREIALALQLMTFSKTGPESAERAFARLGRK